MLGGIMVNQKVLMHFKELDNNTRTELLDPEFDLEEYISKKLKLNLSADSLEDTIEAIVKQFFNGSHPN
jgi:hypothetical protein